MQLEQPDTRIRAIIRSALETCPAIIPQDRRWADPEGQRMAKDSAADYIAHAIVASGVIPPSSS